MASNVSNDIRASKEAGAAATGAAADEPPKVARKKKGRDMPRRPLSAYNFFFREERFRILGMLQEDASLDADYEAHAAVVEKEGRKTGSHARFQAVAKTIAQRWRALKDNERAPYIQLAAKEMEGYKVRKQQHLEQQVSQSNMAKHTAARRQKAHMGTGSEAKSHAINLPGRFVLGEVNPVPLPTLTASVQQFLGRAMQVAAPISTGGGSQLTTERPSPDASLQLSDFLGQAQARPQFGAPISVGGSQLTTARTSSDGSLQLSDFLGQSQARPLARPITSSAGLHNHSLLRSSHPVYGSLDDLATKLRTRPDYQELRLEILRQQVQEQKVQDEHLQRQQLLEQLLLSSTHPHHEEQRIVEAARDNPSLRELLLREPVPSMGVSNPPTAPLARTHHALAPTASAVERSVSDVELLYLLRLFQQKESTRPSLQTQGQHTFFARPPF